jgi:hypothetical protein
MELKAGRELTGIDEDRRTQLKPAKKKKTPPGDHPDGVVEFWISTLDY